MKNNKFKRIKNIIYVLSIGLFSTGIYLYLQSNIPAWGAIITLASFLFMYQGVRVVNALERDEPEEDPRLARHRQESSKVIYVSIVDDAGNLLPDAEAKAKIRQAEAQAGPRDTIIPVNHKV